MKTRSASIRRGALTVEAAVVYPVQLIVLFAIIVGGVGVFRYQQVAAQAREAARWASVHGSDYERETDHARCTSEQILKEAVLPLAAGMDPGQIALEAKWVNPATGEVVDWDRSSRDPKTVTASYGYVNHRIRVTVVYRWKLVFFPGTLTLQSTCDMPLSF